MSKGGDERQFMFALLFPSCNINVSWLGPLSPVTRKSLQRLLRGKFHKNESGASNSFAVSFLKSDSPPPPPPEIRGLSCVFGLRVLSSSKIEREWSIASYIDELYHMRATHICIYKYTYMYIYIYFLKTLTAYFSVFKNIWLKTYNIYKCKESCSIKTILRGCFFEIKRNTLDLLVRIAFNRMSSISEKNYVFKYFAESRRI